MVKKRVTLEVKESQREKLKKKNNQRSKNQNPTQRSGYSRSFVKALRRNEATPPRSPVRPWSACRQRVLTFLLAARRALLLQQALTVQRRQRGRGVLLDSWVGLGERVHRAGRTVRQACCAESSVQGRHTWEHLSNFTKNPTIEKRNCTCSLVLSESRWYYMTLTTTAGHAARHFTKWDWKQRNTTLASGSL